MATAGGWILLALLVALAAHVAAAIGYLYGLLARRLSGSPVFRDLFISRAAVTAYNDAALTALLVARREQKRYYTRLLVRLSFIGPVELVLLGLFFDGFSLPLAATLAIALALLEFSALRRLQHYTDDRAAETVGAAELANAFERVAVEGGVTVKETPSRNWFSSSPSLSARIERLRAEAGTTADGAGATGGGTASAGDRSPTRGR
ncbi:peptidase [Natrialba asiatica DSM 12278]|uniref:Peptidase n=1 Tax=Natrialba asiatica (strain ATCC 700177 / DSM 12278 / JCM 9576 / FERM P-10747 / NBRC 102637 / 172P1) TaxID=29540 RepID=M0ATK4_NATA1|nr:peptidase [Natrialba asiatica DSM 12278]